MNRDRKEKQNRVLLFCPNRQKCVLPFSTRIVTKLWFWQIFECNALFIKKYISVWMSVFNFELFYKWISHRKIPLFDLNQICVSRKRWFLKNKNRQAVAHSTSFLMTHYNTIYNRIFSVTRQTLAKGPKGPMSLR